VAAGARTRHAAGVDEQELPGASHLEVPRQVRVAADWSWRLIVIGVVVVALLELAYLLKLVVLSIFVATLLTALLAPAVRWFQRHLGGSRGWATVVVVLLVLAVLAGLVALLSLQLKGSLTDLDDKFADGLTQIRVWVRNTLGVNDATVQSYIQKAQAAIKSHQSGLVSGALSGTRILLQVLSGAAIAAFATIFLLLDGEQIWAWCVRLFPRRGRDDVHQAGLLSWQVLTSYVRGTVVIAFVDAVSIGLAVEILRVPLAVPIAVLVFFFAFIPIVGAFVSGFVAVVVALAANGVVTALLVLAAIILVQQVEGHLLQPLLMGRLVRVHPLGVVVAVTVGSVLAGLVGAVVAVPLVAVTSTVLGYYTSRDQTAEPAPAELEPG
jgi:putative heme transporter